MTSLLYGILSKYSPNKPKSAILVTESDFNLFGSCPIAAATERNCENISSAEINPSLAALAILLTISLKSLN